MNAEEHNQTQNDLSPGGYREVMRIAWPLIVSTGSFTLMMFCDRMFLAWHSVVAIQAALPAGIIAFTLSCGFMAVAAYAGTFVAQYYGAGDKEGCARAAAQGVFMALGSWPVLLLLIPVGAWMLRFSGHAPAVLDAELSYYTILMIGGVTSPLGAAVSSFFTGMGKTRLTMTANVVANVFNIVLDYGLIFGEWGLPEMGIRGAAWATVIAGFVSPLILLAVFFSGKINNQFSTRRLFRYDHQLFWRMIRFGFPSGVHLALDIASFSVFVMLTGRMGASVLAVSNIALSINLLAFMPLVGLGIAASILVGQYQGSRQSQHAERAGWTALKIGIIYMTVIGASFIVFPEEYYACFSARAGGALLMGPDMLALGRVLLIIMALWGFMDAGNMIIGNALKGAGDTGFVMYYSVAMGWVMLVGGQLLLVLWLGYGIIVAWVWTALYIMVLAVGYLVRFRRGGWKSIEVIDRPLLIEPTRPAGEAMMVVE
ncbi:MAG: MATE family efflux transporter [Deltaproteobacteria bacterium]|nr:MATE family efflux transporter [Deltaproteobacteria bacterium]